MMVRNETQETRFPGLTKSSTSHRFGLLHHQTRGTDTVVQLYPMGDQGGLDGPRWRPPPPFLFEIR